MVAPPPCSYPSSASRCRCLLLCISADVHAADDGIAFEGQSDGYGAIVVVGTSCTVMVNWFYYGNARSNKKTRTDMFGGCFTASVTLNTKLYSVCILETSRRE